ncbi:MAG: DNA polymerase I, partial [Nitrospirota bacterium]
IKGIGEKTARELLSQFKSLDELLKNTGRISKERIKRLVEENADTARLSKKLATLDTSVPMDIDLEELRLREPDWSLLLSLFKELEFTTLIKLIPSGVTSKINCTTILSIDELRKFSHQVEKELAFSIEVSNRDPITGILIGAAFCLEKKNAIYFPVSHSYQELPTDRTEFLKNLEPLFGDETIVKIGHNLKDSITILKRNGVQTRGHLLDTMIASYLINPNKPNHNLEEVTLEYLSYKKRDLQDILGRRKSLAEVPLEEAAPFVCENAGITFELKSILFENLQKNELEDVYRTVEMPLIYVLSDMEMAGVKIDSDKLNGISKEIEKELEGIIKRIYFLAGEEFNINSPKQLRNILFNSLGLQPGKRTKTGYSTEMSVLEELAAVHELPREILNYRSLSKLKTTYIDVLPTLINPETGRVHTSFNQAATATGRLSSSNPNLQNVPVRGDLGRRIREAFIAEENNLLLSADYSQIELRILAHFSGDKGLTEAFNANLDIHARTASEIFNIAIDRVTSDMRRIAKTVNFGVIYGISPFGLSETLNISKEEAKKYIDQYFERHPRVKDYIARMTAEAREKGHIKTLFGRKRAIPEVRSKNSAMRQLGERLAVNSPIQGTAADIIKIAMINIWKKIKDEEMKTRMILQVHDELLFELPIEELTIANEIVRKEMEEAATLSVPIAVEIKYGKNWAEAH